MLLTLSELSEPPPSRMDRHQRQHQTSCSQRCATPVERAQECSCSARRLTIVTTLSFTRSVNVCKATLELSRNSEYVCSSAPPVSDWSTCVGSANAFNSSNRAFDNERKRGINADKKGVDLDVHLCGRRQGATDGVSELRSPHQLSWHPCLSSSSCAPATSAVLNSCDTVSCRKVSLFSLVDCVPNRAIVLDSFVSVALETCQMRKTLRE